MKITDIIDEKKSKKIESRYENMRFLIRAFHALMDGMPYDECLNATTTVFIQLHEEIDRKKIVSELLGDNYKLSSKIAKTLSDMGNIIEY